MGVGSTHLALSPHRLTSSTRSSFFFLVHSPSPRRLLSTKATNCAALQVALSSKLASATSSSAVQGYRRCSSRLRSKGVHAGAPPLQAAPTPPRTPRGRCCCHRRRRRPIRHRRPPSLFLIPPCDPNLSKPRFHLVLCIGASGGGLMAPCCCEGGRERRLALHPAVADLAPCGVRPCSLQWPTFLPAVDRLAPCGSPTCYLWLPGLLPAAVHLAPSSCRRCSMQRPGLLPPAARLAPCGAPSCYFRLPGLLPVGPRLAPSGCRRCSLWRPGLLPPAARLAPCRCRRWSLQWLGLLPPAVGATPCDGPACSLRLPTLLPAVVGVLRPEAAVLGADGGAARRSSLMTLTEEERRQCETGHTYTIFLSSCMWDPEGHVSTGEGGGSGLPIPRGRSALPY
jgi:hypothetical protein